MGLHASGTFVVKLQPQSPAHSDSAPSMGRMSIDKTFAGDLQGTSKGEMLTAGNPERGSAGYVAMERVSGTLQGKSGSFALQHSGTMNQGAFELAVRVVPGSGTDALEGLSGQLDIKIVDGVHHYTFDYSLPSAT